MTRSLAFLKSAYSNMSSSQLHFTFAVLAIGVLMLVAPEHAYAQSTGNLDLPIVDNMICGFIGYTRSKLAPMVAVAVVILSIIGHWLGVSKMWSQFLYVGVGLGVIMGILTAVGNMSGIGSSCPAIA